VAEGVETYYQMKTLQELGCEEMQGYFFSKPLPAGEVVRLLLDSNRAGMTFITPGVDGLIIPQTISTQTH
jgi:predicted signal transduction protein with EAL and GGDEF domain